MALVLVATPTAELAEQMARPERPWACRVVSAPAAPTRQAPSPLVRVRRTHARAGARCCPSPAPAMRSCARHGAKRGSFRPESARFAGCIDSLLSNPNVESVHVPLAIFRRPRGRPGAPEGVRAELCGTDRALALFTSRASIGSAPIRRTPLRDTGPPNIGPSIKRLAAHLLQQSVDERAPEHVEKTASNPSIDA